jgi:hypothetical protein
MFVETEGLREHQHTGARADSRLEQEPAAHREAVGLIGQSFLMHRMFSTEGAVAKRRPISLPPTAVHMSSVAVIPFYFRSIIQISLPSTQGSIAQRCRRICVPSIKT